MPIKEMLHEEIAMLTAARWDSGSISCFVNEAFALLKRGDFRHGKAELLKQSRRIGSPFYERMFRASQLSDRDKAMLPIWQMGGVLDEASGFLILHQADQCYLDPDLAPDSSFLELYGDCVCRGYSGITREIHGLRMYLDKQNIEYIRELRFLAPEARLHYQRISDYEKLMLFENESGQELYYNEASRYHNRYIKAFGYPGQLYDKVLTANRCSEYIIDTLTRGFVTQWDVIKVDPVTQVIILPHSLEQLTAREKLTIANSESFNFGSPGRDSQSHHDFDVAINKVENRMKCYAKDECITYTGYREQIKGKKDLEKAIFG